MARVRLRARPRLLTAALATALCFAASGASLACRSGSDSGVQPRDPASYVEGVAGTWQRINPLFAPANDVDQDLVQLIFAGLVRLGPTGTVEADLADLPQISENGQVYTFRLRPGLEWSDGEPLTSDDVAFTIGLIRAPEFKGDPTLAEAWAGVEVETPSDDTVVMRLKQPYAPFLSRFATLGILPRHLLEGLSASALAESSFNAAPVGAGPFVLAAIDSKEARLAVNPGYHGNKPWIQTFTLRFFPDYPSAVRSFMAGEIDGALVREPLSESQEADVGKVKGSEVIRLQRAAFLVLYLNNDQVMFQDARVRRALSLALDRTTVVDRALAGLATASNSVIPPESWAYVPEFDSTTTDMVAARGLLEESGWIPNPTSGVLTREGSEFRFTIRTDSEPVRVAIAAEIARQLQSLGVRATVASTSFSVLHRDFLQERKYDAAIALWDQGPDPDPYFGWHSSQMGTAGLNIANFADPVVDELIARGRTRADPEVRSDAYRQFQEKWDGLAPSVVIAYPQLTYLHSGSVRPDLPRVLFGPSFRFSAIERWRP